jgi:heme/copper-type cytochrome/quinol oxidase subunit 3
MSAETLAMPRRVAPAPRRERVPPVSNARIAVVVLIASECMLFVGLIGMYMVFRLASPDWPPADLPRLPLGITAVNSLILFASVPWMTRAMAAVRRDDPTGITRGLGVTAILGTLFLTVQGFEWVRLVGHGITLGSSLYGATFYLLIGCHALHVLIAVLWLVTVTAISSRGVFTAARHAPLEMCSIYWYFVCALWVVLFPLVYLA